jgi:hypothetical protein
MSGNVKMEVISELFHSKIFQNENIKKRFRSENFSSEEKHLIFTLVDKYRHIENKKN